MTSSSQTEIVTSSSQTEIVTMKNKSPLRYPGGKTRACKKLDAILTSHFDLHTFDAVISPFFGGGSFEFHLQNKYNLAIVANDKFKPLYSFWDRCKYEKQELCDKLYANLTSLSPPSEVRRREQNEVLPSEGGPGPDPGGTIPKTTFMELKRDIMDEKNALNQAFYYFIINRCSFSGATLSGGFSRAAAEKRFTKSSVDRIQSLSLSNFTISNEDFAEFINRECTPELTKSSSKTKLIFLDPPYYLKNTSTLYGHNGDMHESFDHVKLFKCLSALRFEESDAENFVPWFMTYNNCDYIRNLYKNYTIIETSWSYSMNKTKESSEIVIINNI